MGTKEAKIQELLSNDTNAKLAELVISLKSTPESQLIGFNQSSLILSESFQSFERLTRFIRRFNGLCELVSNCVIKDNLLGDADLSFKSKLIVKQSYIKPYHFCCFR